MHFVVTGGHGYIGQAVVARALRAGHSLTLLGLKPWSDDSVSSIIWRLGEPVPAAAWHEPVDAVIHLAHMWHDTGPEPSDVNFVGSRELIDAARTTGVKRFVFASSLSSRAESRNRYGRVKYRLENILDQPGEVSARIGLVYGGPAKSLWGVFQRLVGKLPVLPMVARRQSVQPIYLDDVAEGLLRLATVATVPHRVVLATDPSLEFGQFLKEIGWRLYRRRLVLLDFPVSPILAVIDGLMRLGVPLMPVRERLLGLVGLTVLSAQADAAWLGLQPLTLQQGLDCEISRRRPREIVEAAVILRYVLGRPPRAATLRRFLRSWRRLEFGAPVLPSLALRCPCLLRVIEPLPSDARPRANALRARLVAAAFVADTEPGRSGTLYAYASAGSAVAWARLVITGMEEALLLLPRIIISRWLWR